MGSYAVRSMAKLVMVALIIGSTVEVSSSSLTEECGAAIEKVTSCLSYATGKAVEPTKECCDAVTGIKEQQPVCLCFFIGQAHNGSQQIKSLGIQEAKLLQLPSACHLTHVNMTKCPSMYISTSPFSSRFSLVLVCYMSDCFILDVLLNSDTCSNIRQLSYF